MVCGIVENKHVRCIQYADGGFASKMLFVVNPAILFNYNVN